MSSVRHWKRIGMREELAGKEGAGYWRSLAELARSPEFGELAAREFPDPDHLLNAPMGRRQAFRLLAASMALAGAAGCTRQPPEQIVPYVNMPEHLVPGRARYYATSALVGGYAHGILAESHEGRPTKIEGNPDHPSTLGACDAIAQASVLSLYDPDRSKTVRHREGIVGKVALLAELERKQAEWDSLRGEGLAFVAPAVSSPAQAAAMARLRERWPRARWILHEPAWRGAVYQGTELLFGRPLEPVYHFDRARRVVSLDADFLQSQPGFLRYARDFMAQRRPRDTGTELARLYAVEAAPSITGAVADHSRALPHDRIGDAARQLARALGVMVAPPAEPPLDQAWVEALAEDLREHAGAALVVPGDQQPAAVHAIAHALNHQLDAVGGAVEFIEPMIGNQGDESLAALAEAIDGGAVDSLVMLDVNPVYDAPANLDFARRYRQVPWRLHWGGYYDETARLSHWHLPAAHALEGWGDARGHDGTVGLVQPLIRPLNGGWTGLQVLAALDRAEQADARELLREYWRERYPGADFETFWRRSLHDGVVADSAAAPVAATPRPDWTAALPDPRPASTERLLQFRPDPALVDGRHANNGWLQEMPRPMTTLTWDNALLVAPALAERERLEEGDIVELTTDVGTLRVPVFVLPGQPERALTLHLGHGRRAAGRIGNQVGTNAFRLRHSDRPWATPVTLKPTRGYQRLAAVQQHHQIEGRDLIRAADLEDFRREPDFAAGEPPEGSLYPEPWPAERDAEQAWGMSIDLSACIGCNACVTACQAENNIPVVGAEEVARGHEMHWIRVDRYFSGSPYRPGTVFQPVPCMHCENAPCEYVCPVGATQHSADGLNQMLYQRCVGTRYCSQNCPYKVRRFNWFDYTSAEADYPARPAQQNPDVTVRSRGVMEKCTYCVQRINTARRNADLEGRPIADGELQTACQQACPTGAIVFGDISDPETEVSRHKAHPLSYGMLEHLNTRPRTTYLAAVRNPNPALANDRERDG